MSVFRDPIRPPIGSYPAIIPVQDTMLSQRPGPAPAASGFLLENGVDFILLEDGVFFLIQEV